MARAHHRRLPFWYFALRITTAVVVGNVVGNVQGVGGSFGAPEGAQAPLEEEPRQRAEAAGWSLLGKDCACQDYYGSVVLNDDFGDCFRACRDQRMCSQFSVGASGQGCRFAMSANGNCTTGPAPGVGTELWHIPNRQDACKDKPVSLGQGNQVCSAIASQPAPTRDVLCVHPAMQAECAKTCGLCPITTSTQSFTKPVADQAGGSHWVEMEQLRGQCCNAHYAVLKLESETVTLDLCKTACAGQRGCNMLSFAQLPSSTVCRFALGGHTSCMPGRVPWAGNLTMWKLVSKSGESGLPSSLSYQTAAGCQSSCWEQLTPITKNISLLPLSATPQEVQRQLGELKLKTRNTAKPAWVYFMGDSTSRAMVEAALTPEQSHTFVHGAHALNESDRLRKWEYLRGQYTLGHNEWTSSVEIAQGMGSQPAKITWDWNPFPYTSRFEWLVRDQFADGKDRPDALVIMGLGIHSCAWEPHLVQHHIWELEHMFDVLKQTSIPVVFVFGRLMNLFARYWWTTPAAINSCLVQFKAALHTLASKSCYPWMDIQDAVDASEDLYGAGADGVHLPGSPYNGAMIRATMEMVKNRLLNNSIRQLGIS